MEIYNSIILGIVQGLTEFLPISSSGHLVLFQSFLPSFDKPPMEFDIFLHFGTLLAVVIYYRRDLAKLVLSAVRIQEQNLKNSRHFLLMLIAGSFPTMIIALIFKDTVEILFVKPFLTLIMLFFTGVILFCGELFSPKSVEKGINLPRALLIGMAQGIAIIPGISRSGITITAGLLLGLGVNLSPKFSFLLSIPAVAGAILFDLKSLSLVFAQKGTLIDFGIGFAFAFITGYLAIAFMLNMVRKSKLYYFGIYCCIISLLGLIYFII